MDLDIRSTDDPLRQLILRTRAGLKTTIQDIELLGRCKKIGFVPLADYRIPYSGAYLYKDTSWRTSLCNHSHQKKHNARMCLRRKVNAHYQRIAQTS